MYTLLHVHFATCMYVVRVMCMCLYRFAAAHFVARRLVYPGSLAFYNLAVGQLHMRRLSNRKVKILMGFMWKSDNFVCQMTGCC